MVAGFLSPSERSRGGLWSEIACPPLPTAAWIPRRPGLAATLGAEGLRNPFIYPGLIPWHGIRADFEILSSP